MRDRQRLTMHSRTMNRDPYQNEIRIVLIMNVAIRYSLRWRGGRVLPETIDRIARYGLELIDELTGGPLVGASKVSTPDDADALGFAVGPSRWVFERLAGGTVHFQVDAAHYLPAALDLVVPASGPGLLTRVSMRPRSGYPFPPALPRVIGQVLFRTAHTPEYRIAVGARVRVGIRYRTSALPSGPVVSGPWLETRTADDGQYTMWFPRLDTGAEYEHLRCRVEVEVDTRSGVLTGDFEQEIQRSATTGLQTLRLGP